MEPEVFAELLMPVFYLSVSGSVRIIPAALLDLTAEGSKEIAMIIQHCSLVSLVGTDFLYHPIL